MTYKKKGVKLVTKKKCSEYAGQNSTVHFNDYKICLAFFFLHIFSIICGFVIFTS